MEHKEYEELVSAYLDGELTAEEEARLRDHLEVCPECRALLEALEGLRELNEDALEEPPAGFAGRVMERVAAQSAPAKKKRPVWRRWAGLGACAALALIVVGSVGWNGLFFEDDAGQCITDSAASPAAMDTSATNSVASQDSAAGDFDSGEYGIERMTEEPEEAAEAEQAAKDTAAAGGADGAPPDAAGISNQTSETEPENDVPTADNVLGGSGSGGGQQGESFMMTVSGATANDWYDVWVLRGELPEALADYERLAMDGGAAVLVPAEEFDGLLAGLAEDYTLSEETVELPFDLEADRNVILVLPE